MNTIPKTRRLPSGATTISTSVDLEPGHMTVSVFAWTDDGQSFLVGHKEAELPTHKTGETAQALVHLWRMAQGYSSSEKAAARFLLGLYNGYRFKFDLTDFRLFDRGNFNRCMLVLAMDHTPKAEVHVMLARALGRSDRDMGNEFEHLAFNHQIKGAVKKSDLPVLEGGAA
jgi:hypothetical protein